MLRLQGFLYLALSLVVALYVVNNFLYVTMPDIGPAFQVTYSTEFNAFAAIGAVSVLFQGLMACTVMVALANIHDSTTGANHA